MNNMDDKDLIITNLGELSDNEKHIVNIMKQYNGITKDLFTLMNKLLRKVENSNALSGYWDWVSYFKKAVEKELGAIVWSNVQYAVYKK